MGIIDQKKGNSALLLEFFHEIYLMFMNILKGEGIGSTFLCVKADRQPLYCADIIHGTLLPKISQCNLTMFLVHLNGGNGGRYLLN